MSQEPITAANNKMDVVYPFFDRNKTIFTMIAIFGALAGFLYSLNKPTNDENLVFGILFLVFLMGLLMTLIIYDASVTLFSLIRQKDDKFITGFQFFFIATFMIFFLMFFESLIEYLYSKYPDWIIWLGIAIFLYFVLFFGVWFNAFIRNKIGTSNRRLIFIIVCYVIILILILLNIYSTLFVGLPHSSNFAEFTRIAQIGMLLAILLSYSLSSIFYFVGILIKSK
jgi:hypothetical protein